MTSPKVAVINLGCRVNRVELDAMASGLVIAGCDIVAEDEASLVVINTCAVTGEAEKKCRKAIRRAAGLPQAPIVVATGCVASLFEDEVAQLAGGVIVEPDKSKVVARCLVLLGLDQVGPAERDGAIPMVTGRSRPGIKVQDGCDNRCTYCIVWKARGAGRSVDVAPIVDAVRSQSSQGVGEVVLSGINLGRYGGVDENGNQVRLSGLLERLLSETDIGRIRLSSIEPPDVDGDLLGLMGTSHGRIAPFLHIPLQSGCDRTLSRMGRTYDAASYASVVAAARDRIPQLALACDLIVGFPGETDGDFDESMAFCRDMGFAKMHVFRYSPRPGTPAATYSDQVDPQTKADRGERLRSLANEMRQSYALSLVGTDQVVCVESEGRGTTGGLVEALVDGGSTVGSLVCSKPSAVMSGTLLDCRSHV